MKPTANFKFEAEGLSVQFTDSSIGVPTSWNWDFGFKTAGNPTTSTSQNPLQVFPADGVYSIKLVASNADGNSEAFVFNILLRVENSLNLTIADMVACNIPVGLAVDSICFKNSIQTWQLFLQPYMNPKIEDADVFNEVKWPPLANVLISKLIIYDIVLAAANSSMASYYSALKSIGKTNNSTSTVLVSDYATVLPMSAGFTAVRVDSIFINGVSYGPYAGTTNGDVINYLNSLGKGNFSLQGLNLTSPSNANVLSTLSLTYTVSGNPVGHNLSFTASNQKIVAVDQLVEVVGEVTDVMMGPIKYLETGPSKTEWYDSSAFWTAMFKKDGVFETIRNEICGFASRIKVQLPFCPMRATAKPIFVTGGSSRRRCCSTNRYSDDKPASQG